MFMFDSKRDMGSIMAKRKKGDVEYGPGKMKNEDSKLEDGSLDGRHLAAQDALNAIKEGSPQKFMDAMVSFHEIHQSIKNKEAEESSGGEPSGIADDEDGF